MTVELPTSKVEAVTKSPRKLIIYSAPKVGKTQLASALDDNLIIDLEDGSDFVSALKIKARTYQEIHEICEEIKAKDYPYKYGTLDTATALEQLVMPLALGMYKQTPMGKNFRGDSVLDLPNGAGWWYVRKAYQLMIDKVKEVFPRLILLGHVKDKLIEVKGKEVDVKELDLTGKLKSLTCADADAVGYLYRDGNQNILTFETKDTIICGARPTHLRNAKFVISESDDEGNVVTYWNKVFID